MTLLSKSCHGFMTSCTVMLIAFKVIGPKDFILRGAGDGWDEREGSRGTDSCDNPSRMI